MYSTTENFERDPFGSAFLITRIRSNKNKKDILFIIQLAKTNVLLTKLCFKSSLILKVGTFMI